MGGIFNATRLCKVVLIVIALLVAVGFSLSADGEESPSVCIGNVSQSMDGAIRGVYCGSGASDQIEVKPSHDTAQVTWNRIADSVYELHWAEVHNTDSAWDLPYAWDSDVAHNLQAVTEYRHTNDCDNWPEKPSAWDSATAYTADTVVSHSGQRYQAVADSTNIEPGVAAGWRNSWTGPECAYEPLTVANFLPRSDKHLGIGSVSFKWGRQSLYIGNPSVLKTTGRWSQCTTDAIPYYSRSYHLPLTDTDKDGNIFHDGAWCWENIRGLKPSTGYTYILERYLKEGANRTLQGRFMGSFQTKPAPITVTSPLVWKEPNATSSTITWDWKDNSDAIYGYILTHRQKGSAAATDVDIAAGTSVYTVSELRQGTEYCATVVPKDGSGNPVEEYRSQEYCITTIVTKPSDDGIYWADPAVSEIRSDSMIWHWVWEQGASRYRFQVYEKGAANKSAPINIDGALSSFRTSGLHHSTEYCAIIWPVDFGGKEHANLASPEHCARTTGIPTTKVTWANPAVSGVSNESITWNWVVDPNVAIYHIQALDMTTLSLRMDKVAGTSGSHTFSDLNSSTEYCATVWPIDREGKHHPDLKSTQCAYTKHNIADAQKRFANVRTDNQGVRWTWDHYGGNTGAQGVNGYDVQWWYNDGTTNSVAVWHETTLSPNTMWFSIGPRDAENYYYDVKPNDWNATYAYCARVVPVTGADNVRALDRAFLQVDTAGNADYDCLTLASQSAFEVSVSVSGSSVVEEGADALFVVTATSAPTDDLAVSLDVKEVQGSGVNAVTYTSQPTVIIPAGQTSITHTHTTFYDQKDLGGGSVTVTITPDAGYTVSETANSASIVIEDDDGNV